MRFNRQLCSHAIIQAPMAGGATTAELVAAVSNAGALGSLAAPLLSPLEIIEKAEHIRRLTTQPFAINLFVQSQPRTQLDVLEKAKELLQPVCAELHIDHLPTPTRWCEDFEAQLDAVITAKPAVASFTFDILQAAQIRRLHEAGIAVVGTATHLAEAQVWQALGADAICLQGVEAGGHRGTFIGAQEAARASSFELLASCRPSINLPLILAGGIMDGHDIARAYKAGADWVQMGTAFLCATESGIATCYKQRLLECKNDATQQTRAFSGRLARGLANRYMHMMAEVADQVPPYPVQNALTAYLRAEAGKQKNTEFMSLWAGQGVAKTEALPAAELLQKWLQQLAQEWQD